MNAIVTRVSRFSEMMAVMEAAPAKVTLAGAEASAEDMRRQISEEIKSGKKYPNLPNVSSAPGEAPANQMGELLDSVHVNDALDVMGVGAEACVGTDHAKYLEMGTSRMAPRPVVGPSFVPGTEAAQVAIKEVCAELDAISI